MKKSFPGKVVKYTLSRMPCHKNPTIKSQSELLFKCRQVENVDHQSGRKLLFLNKTFLNFYFCFPFRISTMTHSTFPDPWRPFITRKSSKWIRIQSKPCSMYATNWLEKGWVIKWVNEMITTFVFWEKSFQKERQHAKFVLLSSEFSSSFSL